MTKVKFCGIQRKLDIDYCNQLKPDFIGFVFAPSKRQITAEKALYLRRLLNDKIQAVGVFVDQSPEFIAAIADLNIIQKIQLHGSENEEEIEQIRSLTSAPLIKAIAVKNAASVKQTFTTDYYLYDTYSETHAGGTGRNFQWQLLRNRPEEIKDKAYFLAGGLNATNLSQALQTVHPNGIDVSSGIETNGFKDYDKMAEIISIVRRGI